MNKKSKEEELERFAKQELLNEARRGAERSKTMGPQGWLKPNLPSMNKRFLQRTLKSASFDLNRPKKAKTPNDDGDRGTPEERSRRSASNSSGDRTRTRKESSRSPSPHRRKKRNRSKSPDEIRKKR